jgi:hypothetical protein
VAESYESRYFFSEIIQSFSGDQLSGIGAWKKVAAAGTHSEACIPVAESLRATKNCRQIFHASGVTIGTSLLIFQPMAI